jgi:hypothetical protein
MSEASSGTTPMAAPRWEYGSEFPWPVADEDVTAPPLPGGARLLSCGRDALRSLVEHGRRRWGWRRIWIPTYICLDLVDAARATGLATLAYPDGPGDGPAAGVALDFAPGDVLLVVNHFGIRTSPAMESLDRSAVVVIEDHTHDPWSAWAAQSDADFAVASLRKTLPLPDGAVLWSPRGEPLPPAPPVSRVRGLASQKKRDGMLLKSQYLQGRDISKEAFRGLLVAGEQELALGEPSGMTPESRALLDCLPVLPWRAVRQENHRFLAARLAGASGVRLLTGAAPGACPFSAVVVFDTPGRREFVRRRLIEQNLYPAVLWPLDDALWTDIPARHRDFSRCMISLPCDMRYGRSDLERVAEAVALASREYAGRRSAAESPSSEVQR